jgi:hypothetical protein
MIQPFLEQDASHLDFFFLPTDSSRFNIGVGLWKWLKADVINIVFYHHVKEIRSKMKSFMDNVMLDLLAVIDRLCLKELPN